jgi:hypothetical protein
MIVGTWRRIPVVAMLLIFIAMRFRMRPGIIVVWPAGIVIKIRIMMGAGIIVVVIIIIRRTVMLIMRGEVIMIGAIKLIMRWAAILITVIVGGTRIFVVMRRRRIKVMTIRVLVVHKLVPTMRTHVLLMIRVFVPVVGVFVLTVKIFFLVIFLITVIGAVGISPGRGGPPITSRGARIALRTRRTRRTRRTDTALFTLSKVRYSRARSNLRALRGRSRSRSRSRSRRGR